MTDLCNNKTNFVFTQTPYLGPPFGQKIVQIVSGPDWNHLWALREDGGDLSIHGQRKVLDATKITE